MSDSGNTLSQVRTNPLEVYDHAIRLIDTTAPAAESNGAARGSSQSPDKNKLTRKTTRQSVRDTIARRKYARWQQGRFSNDQVAQPDDEGDDNDLSALATESTPVPQPEPAGGEENIHTSDFANRPESPDRGRKRSASKEKKNKKQKKKPAYEVDILYENQRGMFFFGIPLYSHSSLLNFDPSPWVTRDFKDSPVNITNAQVPDPSWEWAWRSWYVDMSYDVDEEGWQYSFSFNSQFVWHGTHPWFHSYVRRRRWLRKRVKKHSTGQHGKKGSMAAAHMLNADYFTIHSQRNKSPATTLDGEVASVRSSLMSKQTTTEEKPLPEEIKNIPSLLSALRIGTIDREKIDAVKKFVVQGGEELAYLGEYVPEIMPFFVFQNSRRQLLEFLKQTASKAQTRLDSSGSETEVDKDSQNRMIKNLQDAVKAADGEMTALEYWNDGKNKMKTADEAEVEEAEVDEAEVDEAEVDEAEVDEAEVDEAEVDEAEVDEAEVDEAEVDEAPAGKDEETTLSGMSTDRGPLEENPVDEIKGISEDADVGVDPTREILDALEDEGATANEEKEDKGKSKAVEADEKLEEHEPKESDRVAMPKLAPDSARVS